MVIGVLINLHANMLLSNVLENVLDAVDAIQINLATAQLKSAALQAIFERHGVQRLNPLHFRYA